MLMQWLARGSPKKSNGSSGGGGGGGGARSHSHGGKSKSKDREKEKDSGAIGGAKILSFRKIKVNLNGGNSSFKKDSSKEKSAAGVTRSQSFSTALPLPEPGFELNPARSGSPHASFWHPLPSPDQFFHRNDGWDSTTSSLASDEHDPAAAAAVAAAATTSDKDSCNPSAVACANGQIEAAAKCNNNPRNQQQNQNQNQRQQQGLPISGKRGFPAKQLQIPANRTLGSATDSSLSSPSSPMRAFDPNGPGIWGLRQHHDVVAAFGSGNCSSPGSGTNSTGGDIIGHPFRGSSDRSPVPSPKLRSPGPSSRAQSTAVSPRHPRAGGIGTDSPKECRHGGHPLPVPLPLPLPPRSPTSVCTPFSNMASPSPRSPGSRDNPASPGHRWKKGKLLGRGTFGHVYVGFNSESGEMCAMKEVTLFADDPKSKESVKQLAQEVAMLGHLRHPNIVQYYGCEMVDDTLYIYLEYVSGGSIHKLLQEYGQLGEPAIRSYTQQILSGLAYLHNKNTVHRDIKGANILVDPNGHVKLADFGMAKHISTNSCPLSFKGSPHWMAPEVLKNSNGYDLAVDIWSLGCTIIEMATARPPWSQYEGVAAMFKIGNTKELPEFPPNLSEEGKNFLKLCLQRDPTNRPSAARLLDHPFVKNATLVRIDNNLENADILSCAESTRSSNGMQHPGHARFLSAVDMDYCATPNSRGWPNHQILSDQLYAQRNRSLPLSPNGSPLIQPRSPFHRYGGMSSSPMSTPLASSGCSTPQTGGHDAMPFQANGFTRPSIFVQDNVGNIPKYLLGPNPSFPGLSFDPNPDNHGTPSTFRTTEGSPKLQKVAAAETETLGRAFGGMLMNERGQSPRLYNASMALAEHVSQQFFKSPTHVAGEYRAMSTPQVHRTNNEFY